MKALLLSAGLGTRLGPITDRLPKVMVPVGGKPCLEHHIENLKKQGIKEFAINTHCLPEKIKEYFGDGSKFGVSIKYSFEKDPLGTAGALNNFKDFFTETFIVVCADVIADFKIKEALRIHNKRQAEATILLDKNRDFNGKGVVIKRNDLVEKFIEKPEERISGSLINSGFYILEPTILEKIPIGFYDFGKDLFPKIIKEKKVYCVEHKGYIFDIGTIQDLKKAKEFLSEDSLDCIK